MKKYLGATDMDNGMVNRNTIKNNFDINNYPAFKWCDDKNKDGVTGWYLPAVNELIAINKAYEILNAALDTIGGQKLTELQNYWSLTEIDADYVYSFDYWYLKALLLIKNRILELEM